MLIKLFKKYVFSVTHLTVNLHGFVKKKEVFFLLITIKSVRLCESCVFSM